MSPFSSSFPPQPVVYFRNQPSLPSPASRNAERFFSPLATSHCPLFSYSYELLFPQPLYFHIDLRCPGGDPHSMSPPSFTRTNSITSYHIHVSQAFSCDCALFCATALRYLLYSQSIAHSFYRHGGWYPLYPERCRRRVCVNSVPSVSRRYPLHPPLPVTSIRREFALHLRHFPT